MTTNIKKSGYAYATAKLAKKEEELEKTQVVMGGAMNLLATNTQQRNNAQADASHLDRALKTAKRDTNSLYFELMGRIVKYEPTAFDEVLPYAFENGCFWECDSKELGEYSKIDDYTTKTTKKTYKAHFSIYNTFLKKCETEDDAPISYPGYFLMKNYQDKFEVDRTKTEYKTLKDFFKIKTETVPLIAEPIHNYPTPKYTDGILMGEEDLVDGYFQNDTRKLKIHTNSIYLVYPDTPDLNDPTPILNPRRYDVDIINIGWKTWLNYEQHVYRNQETRQKLMVKKDYDTTPKRKIAKNKIWGINPKAENFLHALNFTKIY